MSVDGWKGSTACKQFESVSDLLMCVSSLLQNGRTPCDADIERLTLNEGYINGSHHVSIFGALTVSIVKFLTRLTLIISLELRIF